MKIGYISTGTPGDADLVLEEFAKTLMGRGLNACGIVQVNSDRENCHRCDMDVIVLPSGPTIRISQSLGKEAKGCRLDPAALEDAVAQVSARLSDMSDVLIVNKFGKHEADGRGFRDVIADALGHDVPVIVAVNAMNLGAFLEFVEGEAEAVSADVDGLLQWFLTNSEKAA